MRLSQDVVDLIRNPESPDGLIRDALMDMGADVANVYVVCGEIMDYDQFAKWPVAAFLDLNKAEDFRVKLQEWVRLNRLRPDGVVKPYDEMPKTCPLDPGYQYHWDGPEYLVETVPLSLT